MEVKVASYFIILGIVLMIIGTLIMVLSVLSIGQGSGSIVIMIGPIPIIGFWGPWGWVLALVSLLIIVIFIIFTFLCSRRPIK